MLTWSSAATAAPPVLVPKFCAPTGSAVGQCATPRGVATNPTSGDIYLVDLANHRVQQFTAWGASIRAWGSEGTASGQFGSIPQGIAIDSAGDVYVVDLSNHRVEKFDAEGNFVLMFGGDVDKTTNANICTAASGDTCGAGVEGTSDGFFSGALVVGSFIAVGPSNKIYVGDQERIQVFNPNGEFLQSLPLPAPNEHETVQALAVDTFPLGPSFGDIYIAYFKLDETGDLENVAKLSSTGSPVATLTATNPRAIATDASNGDVYVVNKKAEPLSFPTNQAEFLRFNASGILEETFGKGDLEESTGIATNSPETCGLESTDLIASNSRPAKSFVRIYGPPPSLTQCPPPKVPPTIDAQFATSAQSTGATVKAKINPHFWTESTEYEVEYGTGECSKGGCTQKAPIPAALLNGSVTNVDLSAAVPLSGLAPDTTYHYRFVAKSDGGGPVYGIDPDGAGPKEATFEEGLEASFHTFPAIEEPQPDSCSNLAFRSGASSRLPDCRAYEMVSPPDKNGGNISIATVSQSQADEAGQRMTYTSVTSFGQAEGAFLTSQYLASREAGGWQSHSVQAPRNTISLYPLGGSNFQYKGFTPDLCNAWFVQDTTEALVEGAPDKTPNLYRRNLCNGGYELLSTVTPPSFKLEPLQTYYHAEPQGWSSNGTRTVFRADDKLTPNAAPETEGEETFQVYESQGDGSLRLVSVLPSKNSSAGKASTLQNSTGTAGEVQNPGWSSIDNVVGAVSGDAERIFWTASPPLPPPLSVKSNHGGGPGALYLRVNAGAEESAHANSGKCTEGDKACTYEVSDLVEKGAKAQFWQGNGEGTRAIFSIGEKLYEFEAEEEEDGRLATPPPTLIAEGFKGFMGASTDVNRVYFVSSKEVEPGVGTPGANNLYFYEKGSGFKLVDQLSALDLAGAFNGTNARPSPISLLPYKRTSRVTPDGLHAAFLSTARLTGFDNTDASNGEEDAEAFLYDAAGGKVVCASCNATGVRPSGQSIGSNENPFWAAARIPGWTTEFQPSRPLSDNGSRLFFESFEPLVPRDTNGRTDVYEWEAAASKAQCLNTLRGELFLTESQGCLSLISSGQSSQDSEFFDATPAGNDVFFATLSSLVGWDTGLVDVYDARVEGGFPEPPQPKASCEGEACQSPPAPPNDQTPSSATYNGPGNLSEAKPKCPKGKVANKQGKCVKKKAKKKKSNGHKKKAKGANKSGRAPR